MRFIVFIISLFPAISYAADCNMLEKDIRTNIEKLNSCWTDSDCKGVYLGCPWQQSVCTANIISTSEKGLDKIKDDISAFNKNCVAQNEDLKKKCSRFEKMGAVRLCRPVELLCLNGRCVNKTQVIMQGEKGVDIYGSRAILKPPVSAGERK